MHKLVNVNRIEVVDWTTTGKGRQYIKWVTENFDVDYDIQDGGRTLKIFLKDMPTNKESE